MITLRQLLTATMLAALAVLTGWLLLNQGELGVTDKAARFPDSYFRELNVRQFGDDGLLTSELRAAAATHFPNDEHIYLESVDVKDTTQDQSWRVTGERGKLDPNEDQLKLSDGVEIIESSDALFPVSLRAAEMDFDLQRNVLHTREAITLQQGSSFVRGIGLVADMNNDYLEIPAAVKARYEE